MSQKELQRERPWILLYNDDLTRSESPHNIKQSELKK